MKGSVVWKLALTVLLCLWALFNLLPLEDRPFPDYLRDQARAEVEAFTSLLAEAEKSVAENRHPTVYLALRELARERRIDLARHFPQLELEDSVRNLERRNRLILDELLKRSKARLRRGLDLRGGVAFILEVGKSDVDDPATRASELSDAIRIIDQRVNALGVSEPIIRPVGNNRIEVQLADVSTRDNPEAVQSLSKPARLEFRLVHPTLRPTGEPGEEVPLGYEILTIESEDRATGNIVETPYFVKRVPELTGGISRAVPRPTDVGGYRVDFQLKDTAAKRFAEITSAHVNRQLAIVLDGRLVSAPNIQSPITTGSGVITGQFTQRQVIELANVLNNPLEVPLTIVSMNEVGASLAADSIRSGVVAAIVGAALVVAFMLVFYRSGGLVSLVSLAMNVLLVLGVLCQIGATLTLPGIAGIVLTIGMAVDANILIFERIREELRTGRSLKAALAAGHDRALTAIVDANLTTLITSAIMIAVGTGPVKGFGVTLTIGVFTTMFGSLVVSRMILEWLVHREVIRKLSMPLSIRETAIDFMRFAKPAFVGSFALVWIGSGVAVWKVTAGHPVFGIDFVGGDEILLSYQYRLPAEAIREAGRSVGAFEVNPLYQTALGGGGDVLRIQTDEGKGAALAEALLRSHPDAGLTIVGENRIGAAVSHEILLNALLALAVALVGITLYIAFRFELGYGIGAIVSTLHDVLVVIACFVLAGGQFSAPMVAAILLIIGYSINDTIVVFDRIREELTLNPNLKLRAVINAAINATLQRTLATSATTLLAASSLWVFGTGIVKELAFTFVVGIITGTFSSVYIASPVLFWWHKGDRTKLNREEDVAQTVYPWQATSKAAQ